MMNEKSNGKGKADGGSLYFPGVILRRFNGWLQLDVAQ